MSIRTHTVAIVGLIIGVVLFAAVLVPIVNSSTMTTEIERNTGTSFSDFGPANLVSSNSVITSDGVTIDAGRTSLVACGYNFALSPEGIKYFDSSGVVSKIPTGTDVTDWTFTIDEIGHATFTAGTETLEFEAGLDSIHRSANGALVSGSNNAAYLNENAVVVAFGRQQYSNAGLIYGVIQPKQSATVYVSTAGNVGVPTHASVTLTETDRAGVYTASATSDAGSISILVPVEYYVPATATGTVYTILNILPIISLLGIVMAAAYFAANRD